MSRIHNDVFNYTNRNSSARLNFKNFKKRFNITSIHSLNETNVLNKINLALPDDRIDLADYQEERANNVEENEE